MLLFMPTQDEYALRSHTLAHTAASVRTLVAFIIILIKCHKWNFVIMISLLCEQLLYGNAYQSNFSGMAISSGHESFFYDALSLYLVESFFMSAHKSSSCVLS